MDKSNRRFISRPFYSAGEDKENGFRITTQRALAEIAVFSCQFAVEERLLASAVFDAITLYLFDNWPISKKLLMEDILARTKVVSTASKKITYIQDVEPDVIKGYGSLLVDLLDCHDPLDHPFLLGMLKQAWASEECFTEEEKKLKQEHVKLHYNSLKGASYES